MKLCLVCSVGGHLSQMLQLERVYSKYDHFFVTFKNERTSTLSKKEKVKFVSDPGRSIFNLSKCFLQTYRILKKENPDIIITTGAGVALPAVILGKISNKKIILIESFSRVKSPSLFGRMAYYFSDLTLVQWKKLLETYPKAIYSGPIFNFSKKERSKNGDYIFLMVGSHDASFHRLIKEIDELVDSGKIKYKVVAQIGPSKYIPKKIKWFRLSSKLCEKYIKNCKIFITHGGIGCILDGIKYGKKIIVVPRYKKFNEHTNDHQLDITKEMERQKMVIPVYNIENLEKSINEINKFKINVFKGENKVIKIIEKFISDIK